MQAVVAAAARAAALCSLSITSSAAVAAVAVSCLQFRRTKSPAWSKYDGLHAFVAVCSLRPVAGTSDA